MINKAWVPIAAKLDIPRDEFFALNPKKFYRYMEFYVCKRKERERRMSEEAWMHGSYVAMAIAGCFGKKHKYPDKPIDFHDGQDNENQEPVEQLSDADKFAAWAMTFNQIHFNNPSLDGQESEVNEDGGDG